MSIPPTTPRSPTNNAALVPAYPQPATEGGGLPIAQAATVAAATAVASAVLTVDSVPAASRLLDPEEQLEKYKANFVRAYLLENLQILLGDRSGLAGKILRVQSGNGPCPYLVIYCSSKPGNRLSVQTRAEYNTMCPGLTISRDSATGAVKMGETVIVEPVNASVVSAQSEPE